MFNKPNKALYLKLVDDVLLKLTTSQFKVGDRLPPEAEYAASLGVSRSTLRLAFARLEQLGILKRRKRGGTEIISAKPVSRFSMKIGGNYNWLNTTRETFFEISEVKSVGCEDNEALEKFSDESKIWLRCTGVRRYAGEPLPFIWSQIYVAENFSDLNLKVGDTPNSLNALIEERYGLTLHRVVQSYSAKKCSESIAEALGLVKGSAVVSASAELYKHKNELLLYLNSVFDSKRFKVTTEVDVTTPH